MESISTGEPVNNNIERSGVGVGIWYYKILHSDVPGFIMQMVKSIQNWIFSIIQRLFQFYGQNISSYFYFHNTDSKKPGIRKTIRKSVVRNFNNSFIFLKQEFFFANWFKSTKLDIFPCYSILTLIYLKCKS